ncbi:MAG TPA: arylsulfotransferase family protein [Thermomicrobiales bacterium]|nr:arylsulfotransferase family protein [Thermomicrobiales bacterium]
MPPIDSVPPIGPNRRQVLIATGASTLTAFSTARAVGAQSATPVASPVATGTGVQVFPRPGAISASPWTQLTFRSPGLTDLGPVEVHGEGSGFHPGVSVAHSDGNGLSWYPDFPFHPGEVVSVRTRLEIVGTEHGDFNFTTVTPKPLTAEPTKSSIPDADEVHTYQSRPGLAPTVVTATAHSKDLAPGYFFLSPKRGPGRNGVLIVDNTGEPIFFQPVEVEIEQSYDFKVIDYAGQPHLIWWQGNVVRGHGFGHWVIKDGTYQTVRTIQVQNGYDGGDLHDIALTDRGTALIGTYNTVAWDLKERGGDGKDWVIDNIIQEIDLATDAVVFEWHALDHIAFDETKTTTKFEDDPEPAFDYMHWNSLAEDADGNLILSARNTWAKYGIDRISGDVLWRLGGTDSDFKMGDGAETAWQHDARPLPGDQISLFDNSAAPAVLEQSRGLILQLDQAKATAEVVREYMHPDKISSGSQGNLQLLDGGHVVIGWGDQPVASEFDQEGTLLLDLRYPEGRESYRAFKFPWIGRPATLPNLAVAGDGADKVSAFASWNGATEVAAWQLLGGDEAEHLTAAGPAVARTGFETTLAVTTNATHFAVQALDRDGTILATSHVTKR